MGALPVLSVGVPLVGLVNALPVRMMNVPGRSLEMTHMALDRTHMALDSTHMALDSTHMAPDSTHLALDRRHRDGLYRSYTFGNPDTKVQGKESGSQLYGEV